MVEPKLKYFLVKIFLNSNKHWFSTIIYQLNNMLHHLPSLTPANYNQYEGHAGESFLKRPSNDYCQDHL